MNGNKRLSELQLQRGRLLERIVSQRATLAREARPLVAVMTTTDRYLGRVQRGMNYLKAHPSIATIGVAALLFVRGGRLWQWARRGVVVWRVWHTLEGRLRDLGWRGRA